MDLAYFRENHGRMFDGSAGGLQRIRAIVQNLRDFARLDEAEYKEVDLNAALRSTLEALRHELNQKAIRVETGFQELTPRGLQPRQDQPGLPHILLNAIQASERRGTDRGAHPARRRGRRRGGDRGPRRRDPSRALAAHLRALLHDQAGGRRDRAGPLRQLRDRPRPRRLARGRERRRPGQRLPRPAAGAASTGPPTIPGRSG